MSLIKLAKSKWGQFLEQAKSHSDLGDRISQLLKHTEKPHPILAPNVSKYQALTTDLTEHKIPLKDAIKKGKYFVKDALNQPDKLGSPLHSLISAKGKESENTLSFLRGRIMINKIKPRLPLGGEEYHDIYHGVYHNTQIQTF